MIIGGGGGGDGGGATGGPTVELGIEIPQGDPGALEATASSLTSASGAMTRVASILRGNGSLAGWQGRAETSYTVAASLQASSAAHSATQLAAGAGALQRAASELTTVQAQVGQDLLAAEDAQRRIDQANREISDAQGRIIKASAQLIAAETAVAAAAIIPSHPGASAAAAARTQAQQTLQQAQGDLQRWQTQLSHAQTDLKRAQLRARDANQVWHGEAQTAAAALNAATQPANPLTLAPFGTATPFVGGPGLPTGVPPVFLGAPLAGKSGREQSESPPLTGVGVTPPLSLASAGARALPVDPAALMLSGVSGYAGYSSWAAKTQIAADHTAMRQLSNTSAELDQAAQDPTLSAAERATAQTGARAAESEMGDIVAARSGLRSTVNFADHTLGFAVGGVGDMAVHIAEGESVTRSAVQGAASAAGGYAGAAAGGWACADTVVGAPLAPLCAGAGGIVGSAAGDLVGGLVDDVLNL